MPGSCYFSKDARLSSPRIPKKQSSSCPSSSGQAVRRLWWNTSSAALVSSSTCQRKLALSPSCSQVRLPCYMLLWKFFSDLRSHPWRPHALSPRFWVGPGAHLGAFLSNRDSNTKFLDLVPVSLQTQHWALFPLPSASHPRT